jgi:hypothetical protein
MANFASGDFPSAIGKTLLAGSSGQQIALMPVLPIGRSFLQKVGSIKRIRIFARKRSDHSKTMRRVNSIA